MPVASRWIVDDKREFLRHTLATVAYRGGKALRDAPPEFGAFRIGETTRTPLQILTHVNDLYDWALSMAKGQQKWHDSTPGSWASEVQRFHQAIAAFDAYLASNDLLGTSVERMFQGPVADSLTHIGQISMLRRLAGAPVKGENYAKAAIAAGVVGESQPAPRVEFD
jgi:hypothetical protein